MLFDHVNIYLNKKNQYCCLVIWEKKIKLLEYSNGLAYKQELPPELFVVHPSNRGGFG